jgi:hypothetical protein
VKQTVVDRYGNRIYLTDERWQHIVDTHPYMIGHEEHLLQTLRTGRRKQDALDVTKYKYYKKFKDLEGGFNHVVVIVKCEPVQDNNFVLTAYQTFIYSR